METVQNDNDLPEGAFIPHDIFYMSAAPIAVDGVFYRVNRAGITTRTPSNFLIKRSDAYLFNILHCVISGKGTVRVGKNVYPVIKGQLFLLSSFEKHVYESSPDDPMGLAWVEFAGGDSNRLVRHIIESEGNVFGGKVFKEVVALCTSLLYRKDSCDAETSLILYQILIALCCNAEKLREDQNKKLKSFLDYIDEHLNERLSLAMVAGAFGYNPSYFSSLFSKVAGMSFCQSVLHRRVSRACLLLMTTTLSIERIGQELGFFDESHFVIRFKSVAGVTPAKYRRDSHGLAHQEKTND